MMKRKFGSKSLSLLLVLCMVFGLLGVPVFAEDDTAAEPTDDFAAFLANLRVLEGYADEYAAENTEKNAVELVLNYIRTGVPKYAEATWSLVAGPEDTGFTAFVAQKDEANGTTASALRNLEDITVPNGQTLEFKHMFGTMNITWYQRNSTYATVQADMGGWAGDVCDLMEYTNGKVDLSDLEAAATTIRTTYLGVDDPGAHSFGTMDLYGDLDAYHLMNEMKKDPTQRLSDLMQAWFTADLTDAARADYFMTNRTGGTKTHDGVRAKLLQAYTENSMVSTLESSRSLGGDAYADLRTACIYAFADYLTELAGDESAAGTDDPQPTESPDPTPTPTPTPTPQPTTDPNLPSNEFYSVFSKTTSTLAPGVEQSIYYATTTVDQQQMVFYTATVDISRDDLNVYANYNENDGSTWGMSRVTDQIAAAVRNHADVPNYNPVVGVNADFFNMTTGTPSGLLVMEGVIYKEGGSSRNFFAIKKDGTAMIGSAAEWNTYRDDIKEAVGASIVLVKDGKSVVNTTSNYYKNRASRTCVGITADGKVVLMVLDGRQPPFSCGGSSEEIAQIMIDAGCVDAVNLDGGGSTTFAAKEEGEDHIRVVNRPSDGYERSVSSSLMVVSTAKPMDAFDHALIRTEDDLTYLTKNSALQVSAIGVNNVGGSAALPENVSWASTNPAVGTVDANGLFTAVSNGTADVQLLDADGTVLCSETLNVVSPDRLSFEKANQTTVYEATIPLPLQAWYQGHAVKVSPADVWLKVTPSGGGSVDGFAFTACSEEAGFRNVKVSAMLEEDLTIEASTEVNIFSQGEAVFDFYDITGGDRRLAWNREVSNAFTDDDTVYYNVDPSQPMEVSYVFALDMREIPVPERLKDMVGLIAGGDVEGASPWKILLQLANRVSPLTEVEIDIHVDEDMQLDYSDMTIVTDYFHLTRTEMDEATNTLKVFVNWNGDNTQPIDEASANPICIVSGLKMTPKDDAAWNGSRLEVKNSGTLSYDIYLAASALFTDAFEEYGLYKYDNSQGGTNYAPDGSHLDRGSHFTERDFQSFSDQFYLDKSVRQGWYSYNDQMFYYVDNVAVTGIQKLPSYEDETVQLYYRFDETGACQGKITGLTEIDGAWYYLINGKPATGWREIDGEYYYFRGTGKAQTGEGTFDGITYQFDDNGRVHGKWVTDDVGTRYYYGPKYYRSNVYANSVKFVTIDGSTYGFGPEGYRYEGVCAARGSNSPLTVYAFTDEGVCLGPVGEGLHWAADGTLYYTDANGVCQHAGLMKIGEDYYYAAKNGVCAVDVTRVVSESATNGLLPAGTYTFGPDGKMVIETPKNGIVEENGGLVYYEDGKRVHAGLIRIDGDYYYVANGGIVATDTTRVVNEAWTNGLLPAGTYTFGPDGKMVMAAEKNGIVEEETGLYYYENGKRVHAGLIRIDGEYYYVAALGVVVTNTTRKVNEAWTNGLLPAGMYTFGADGRMIREPEAAKNGIVAEDGGLYYYEDGKRVHAGLIQIDGDYYYVAAGGIVAVDTTRVVNEAWTNGLLPAGTYTFGPDGKMLTAEEKDGIVAEDGGLYYYRDGKRFHAGLVLIDGDYYYVAAGGVVAVNTTRKVNEAWTNGLLPAGMYTFGADGKMVQNAVNANAAGPFVLVK